MRNMTEYTNYDPATVRPWLETRCTSATTKDETPGRDMFADFQEFVMATFRRVPLGRTSWSQTLTELGHPPHMARQKDGPVRTRVGLKLR